MTDVTEAVSTDGAKAEALGKKITFTHNDVTYTVLESGQWPVEAIERFEDGAVTTAVRLILGPDEWSKFRATDPVADDVEPLVVALQKAAGISGN
jgi:hypothetical protein